MKKTLLTLAAAFLAISSYSQSLDTTFGTNGIAVNELTAGVDALNTIALQPDGKIIAAGYAGSQTIVARYLENGALDTTFGDNGIVYTGYTAAGFTAPLDIAIQPEGKIVLMAHDNDNNFVARYLADGTPDTTFGTNGVLNVNNTIGVGMGQFSTVMKLLNDGRIIVVGDRQFLQDTYMMRYNADGQPDSFFDGGGYLVTVALPGYQGLAVKDIYVAQDGYMYVAASLIKPSGYTAFGCLRYTPEGQIDMEFGTNGTSVLDISGENNNDAATTIKVQPDGKILVAGTSGNNFAVVRYNADGSPDTTFNSTGIVTTAVGGAYRVAADMLLEPDGKIIVAGYIGDDFAAVRYNANGSLDTGFGTDGIYKVDFDGSYDYGNAIVRQPDGKYIMAGWTSLYCTDRGLALMRFSSPLLDAPDNFVTKDVTVFPNPTNGLLTVSLPETFANPRVIIHNSLGQEISNTKYAAANSLSLAIEGAQGIYFVEIQENGKIRYNCKVVKM